MRYIFLSLVLFSTISLTVSAQDTTSLTTTAVPANIAGTTVPIPIVKLIKTPAALGISPKTQKRIAAIANPPINLALFAVDRRDKNQEGNSDVIMIITIDQVTKKIKMSSILRDTYVNIEGKGMDKINAAFALGGPQLAIKTINQNFDMDIQDYINVDFFGTAKMIDALGGVEINVKPEEIPYLNNYLKEISIIENIPPVNVNNAGIQVLNGRQTVAYTRIRAVGRGDYERTERQRTVLVALFNKMKGAGPALYPVFMNQILPNMETSLSGMNLFKIGGDILNSKSKIIEQARFPLDSSSKGIRVNNIWYLSADLKVTTAAIHSFIYKGISPAR
ncbi:LytR/CpsA family transcriptional attenuator [Pedobacter cryoconitis]|uniref:LytR/CpsA family transcriptional attenuator n=1 Tax=Pedobacter cryoconitis TaxID=188932 RepID=A0A127V856_9SPHI|nr:LCP family protein [Pedobacter cryoconitis]AMP97158.1 LytR/CpsA family transcriptional attenuator [Pedobacter cryoconitis]